MHLFEAVPDAGVSILDLLLEVLEKPASPPAKNGLIKGLWSIHTNTSTSIRAGDEVFANLIRDGDLLVVERTVQFIGSAVVEDPSEFPETLKAIADVLETPDEQIVRNAAVVIGTVARDQPELVPEAGRVAEKLETVRDWEMMQEDQEVITEALNAVRMAAKGPWGNRGEVRWGTKNRVDCSDHINRKLRRSVRYTDAGVVRTRLMTQWSCRTTPKRV